MNLEGGRGIALVIGKGRGIVLFHITDSQSQSDFKRQSFLGRAQRLLVYINRFSTHRHLAVIITSHLLPMMAEQPGTEFGWRRQDGIRSGTAGPGPGTTRRRRTFGGQPGQDEGRMSCDCIAVMLYGPEAASSERVAKSSH